MEKLKNYYKYIILVILIIIFIIFSFIFFKNANVKEEDNEVKIVTKKEEKEESKEESKEDTKTYIYVDLKGAVNNPNVYQLEEGSRIIDLINLAGGLKEDADTSILNLSKKLTDEMCIIIYTKSEIDEYKKNY